MNLHLFAAAGVWGQAWAVGEKMHIAKGRELPEK